MRDHSFRRIILATSLVVPLAAAPVALSTPAAAAGCVSGAVVGGVAGHMVGHGKLGAVAGCVAGHHKAKEQEQAKKNSAQPQQPPAH